MCQGFHQPLNIKSCSSWVSFHGNFGFNSPWHTNPGGHAALSDFIVVQKIKGLKDRSNFNVLNIYHGLI